MEKPPLHSRGVVEIDDGFHATLFEVGYEVVETAQEGVVIDSGRCLHYGFYVGGETFAAVAAGKDAEVADAKLLQAVEFAGETLAVASASFRGKYGAIPKLVPT